MGREGRRGRVSWFVVVPFTLTLGAALLYVGLAAADDWRSTPAMDWIYNATFLTAGAACLARAIISPRVRWAWVAFGVGLIGWAAGDIYWTEVYSDVRRVPYPSLADAGYLLAPLAFFIGIPLLIKERMGRFTRASLLDAAIGALAVTALGTAVLAPALVGLTKGDSAAVITNLAYPLFDLALLAMVAGTVVLGRPREARSLLLVGLGLLVWAAADVQYLFLEATSSYEPGWIDSLWLLGGLAIAAGALVPPRTSRVESGYRASLALPAVFTSMAVAVLVWDHFDRLPGVSIWLAAATLLGVALRLGLSSRENDMLVHALHDDAVTDSLTGLGNRRRLFSDLGEVLASGEGHVFALFDLDGFKAYNDAFGHPAGDALLRRLGANLTAAVEPRGCAYRLGGDEFCILVELGSRRPASVFEGARESLKEEGEGFAIGASGGWLVVSAGTGDAEGALRDADRRMYEEKSRRSVSVQRQTHDVLVRIFRGHEPRLGEHGAGVARLAGLLGRSLELEAESQDVLVRAAELHDVGKIAIPEEILHKRGPLDAAEWDLIRRHTLIGDRILAATPALRPVARLVRSSHERWDGAGYPDGLAGEEIPLGARIIYICDAFDAMTSERPYREASSPEEALAEIRRCSGSQFDPELVEVFCGLAREVELTI